LQKRHQRLSLSGCECSAYLFLESAILTIADALSAPGYPVGVRTKMKRLTTA
jgi:hypothetical protein